MTQARKKVNLELYKKIYLIRSAEEAIVANYDSNEMKTPMHMSMGEEAIVVGICQALGDNSQVFGTYRSHALYLAKTGETDKFFAEMYGKITGVIKGKGGSMHLSAPDFGLLATSAVVASTIPVAVGASYANKLKKNKKVVAVFFGDGAVDEGVFWESLNIACLLKLPMIFVCEDNSLAVHTYDFQRHGYKSISEIVSKYNCKVFNNKSTNVEAIYSVATKAIESSLATSSPSFIHTKYYRYLEHVGVKEDFGAGYRSIDEFRKWLKKDPIKLQRSRLLKNGVSERKILRFEKKIEKQVLSSLEKAKHSLFPNPSELYKDVFFGTNE